jgi:hypothetical protein
VAWSDGARALVRERRVRALVLGYGGAAEEEITALAATAAGAALAAGARLQKAPLEPLQAARAVAEQLAGRGIQEPGPYAERARRAFEATRTALAEAERDGEPQGGADRARPSPVS